MDDDNIALRLRTVTSVVGAANLWQGLGEIVSDDRLLVSNYVVCESILYIV